jgi:hypothetical protein
MINSRQKRSFTNGGYAFVVAALLLAFLSACSTSETSVVPQESDTGRQSKEPTDLEKPESIASKGVPTGYEGVSYAEGITDSDVLSWVEAAIAEMSEPPTSFLGLIWPIGAELDEEPDPEVFDGAMFREHTQVLSAAEVDAVVDTFVQWETNLQCESEQEMKEVANSDSPVESWIRGGADVATAPDPCFEARSAIYAWPEQNSVTTAKEVFFHESYHGLSNYLGAWCAKLEGKPEENYDSIRWFAEGTAEYFGHYMAAKVDGRDDYVQRILEKAYLDYQTEPGELFANAYFQAAALHLMVERGVVTQAEVLDGSIFHDCSYVERFDPDQSDIKYIFENFGDIEIVDDAYKYSDEALNG